MAKRLFCSRNYLAQVETGAKEPSQRLVQFLESLAAAVLPENTNQPPAIVAEAPAPYHAGLLPKSNARIAPPPPNLRQIPVLSWAHAGEAGTYEQIAEHEQEQIFYDGNDPRAFVVIIEGESMLPKFVPGDRAIIAPSREPVSGNYVVIKLANDGILIRLFHRVDSKTIRLISLNPDRYPDTILKNYQYRWCWPVQYSISRHL